MSVREDQGTEHEGYGGLRSLTYRAYGLPASDRELGGDHHAIVDHRSSDEAIGEDVDDNSSCSGIDDDRHTVMVSR